MLFDMVMEELHAREVYKADIYAPYYISSFATHVFNLMNQERKIYWESKRLPNMRTHLLFVAPPGFMKSFYLQQMATNTFGIFRNCGIDIGNEQYMTEAGFVGQITSVDGIPTPTPGAAHTYAKGLLCIDEFSAITKALQTQHSNQLEGQLLSALDHGHITKRLGPGKLDYNTYLTLWAGVQPAKFDLTSGMGRRLIYMVFIPSRYDNEKLLETMQKTRNLRPGQHEMQSKWREIRKFRDDMKIIETVEFDDSVLNMYSELGLFSFEASYFDRLLLGYHLAMYGPEKHMTIGMKDEPYLQKMIEKQKKWRGEISLGIEYVQLKRIIQYNGGAMRRTELINEAAMYGWNGQQVTEMLEEMRRGRLIGFNNKTKMIEVEE